MTKHLFTRKGYTVFAVGFLGIALVAGALAFWLQQPSLRNRDNHPEQYPHLTSYVDDSQCMSCHTEQTTAWMGSHHQQAMQVATAETVLGDFDDATFVDEAGISTRFFKEGGRFFIHTMDADGVYKDFEVKYTFGLTPLQQYLVELPRGRFQAYTVAWDTYQERWFSLFPEEAIEPDNRLFWTNLPFTWNSTCAECHSTNLQLNYDLASDTYHTSWSAISVGCQACHGAGAEHVAWAQSGSSTADRGLMIDYDQLDTQGVAETCAPCHSRRFPVREDDVNGLPYLDNFLPELLRDGLYHADGQQQDEVYIYGSFVQSKMYHAGVSCIDCHNPHTATTWAEGNGVCLQCHQPNPPLERFPTLQAKVYDSPTHHFHEIGSEGAQCVACHAPTTDYMVVDPRHDHSFRIPRPDLTTAYNTPNACNLCHTEQSSTWATERMIEWYGTDWQDRASFAPALYDARMNAAANSSTLVTLANNTEESEIIRATAIDLLSESNLDPQYLITAFADPAPLIRATAVRSIGGQPSETLRPHLVKLLDDPIQAVRIEAAKLLSSIPSDQLKLNNRQRSALENALQQYIQAQLALPDHPQGHVNLGQLYQAQGKFTEAEQSYLTAIARDPYFPASYTQLAMLQYRLNRTTEAETTLTDGLAKVEEKGTLYYTLGLLLVETNRPNEALTAFEAGLRQDTHNQRLYYNYGLLLNQLGKTEEAERMLLDGLALNRHYPDLLYAITTFYAEHEDWEQAHAYALELVWLFPQITDYAQLLMAIEQRLGN